MHPPVQLRSLTADDLALLRLWMRDAPEAPRWSDAELARLIPGTVSIAPTGRLRRAWLAEPLSPEPQDLHQPVGFIVASGVQLPDGIADCELEFLFVVPDQRRGGIGRTLVDTVLDWAAELNARQVCLEVRASNRAAQSLYRACGFTSGGQRPGYYANPREDALLMTRRLGQDAPSRPV